MALETQLLDVPIQGGLAQNVDPHVIPPGSFARLHNVVYNRHGAIQKRHGYGTLPDDLVGGGTLPEIEVLATRQQELLGIGEVDDGLPRIFSQTPAQDGWVAKDRPCLASVQREPVVRSVGSAVIGQVIRVVGHLVYVWATFGQGIVFRIVDEETGAVIQNDAVLASSGLLHSTFKCGDSVVIVYTNGDDILAHRIDFPAGTSATATLTTTDSEYTFDACAVDDDVFAMAYWSAVDQDIRIATFDVATLASTNDVFFFNDTVLTGLAIAADATSIIVVGCQSSGNVGISSWTHGIVANWDDLVTNVAPDEPQGLAVGFRDNGSIVVLFAHGDAVYSSEYAPNGTPQVGFRVVHSAMLWSRPFVYNDRLYVVLVAHGGVTVLYCLDHVNHTGGDDEPFLLCGYTTVLAAEEGFTEPFDPAVQRVSVVAGASGTDFLCTATVRTTAEDSSFANLGIDLTRWDFAAQQAALYQSVEVQGCLAQSGGFAGWYDGQAMVEQGFVNPPRILSHVVHGGDGNIAGEGTGSGDWAGYGYCAVYEWLDSAGNLHQSEPSDVYTVGVLAAEDNAEVELEISCLSHTRRGDVGINRDITVAVFRTKKNAPEQFFRVSTRTASPHANPTNVRTDKSVDYFDDISDAQIDENAWGLLYTDGGILPNLLPSAPRSIVLHKSRLWSIASDDERTVQATKLLVRGEAPGWNPGLSVRIDDAPEGATAIASLDDKLVIFTPTRIYYVAGDGPNDQGAAGSFSGPFLVSSSVGCTDCRSVVSFEGGVLFLGEAGFHLLDRALNLQFVGAPVEDEVLRIHSVLGVVLDAARSRVIWQAVRTPIFVIIGDEGQFVSFPRYLVFDYEHKAWCTWSIDSSIRQNSHVLYEGAHVVADQYGVQRESYGDNPGWDPQETWIQSVVQTPWVHVGAIGGYQRCRRVQITARKLGQHNLLVELFTDFDDATAADSATFDVTITSPLPGDPLVRPHMHVGPQKCSAFAVRMTDSYEGLVYAGEAGFALTGITLELGLKKGTAKLRQVST